VRRNGICGVKYSSFEDKEKFVAGSWEIKMNSLIMSRSGNREYKSRRYRVESIFEKYLGPFFERTKMLAIVKNSDDPPTHARKLFKG
jgi:hypothetical protein